LPPSTLPLSDKMLELVAHRFRMLGDPTRLRLLQCLESGGKSVNEITAQLDGNQPNISKHLQVLSEAGLVHRSRSGNRIYYSIADPVVFKLCALVCHSAGEQARTELEELLNVKPKRVRQKT
jgi:DNA-binding transcriptional ArsR family regulator